VLNSLPIKTAFTSFGSETSRYHVIDLNI